MLLVVPRRLAICRFTVHESGRPQPSIQFDTPNSLSHQPASQKYSVGANLQPFISPNLNLGCTYISSQAGVQSLAPGLLSPSPRNMINVAAPLSTLSSNIQSPTSAFSQEYNAAWFDVASATTAAVETSTHAAGFIPFRNALKTPPLKFVGSSCAPDLKTPVFGQSFRPLSRSLLFLSCSEKNESLPVGLPFVPIATPLCSLHRN